MKKCVALLAIILATVSLVSCDFSEHVYITEDGSGKIALEVNADKLMEMGGADSFSDSTATKKVMDSVFYFRDYFKEKQDSIAQLPQENQDRLKKLGDIGVKMHMNEEAKEMNFTFFSDFDDIEKVPDMASAMSNAQAMKGGSKTSSSGTSKATEIAYSYNGKKFSKKVTIVNKELLTKEIDSLQSLAVIFEASTYTFHYHFPKRIKKVSSEYAEISDDKKSVSVSYEYMEYIKNPEIANIEVTLQKK